MALQQVMETRLIRFAICFHWFVQTLLIERRLVHAVLEIVAILLNLLTVERPTLLIS